MNDMTLKLEERSDADDPFAAIFAIEQQLFKKHQSRALDCLEKGFIQFKHKQSFDPHEPAIVSTQRTGDGEKVLITSALFSLTGANGILPNHYSETLAKSLRDKNHVLKDFLDMFNHRLNSLMYRSWAKYRLDTDKSYQANVSHYQSTADLIMTTLAGESYPMKENSSAYYSGLTYACARSADKLKSVINDLSGLNAAVNEFQGKWIELEDDQLSRMGSNGQGVSFNQLGVNTMLGRRCWDLSSSFEVEFEVNDAATFRSLTPGGKMNRLLNKTLKNLVGDGYEFNFKLKVKAKHCQTVQLSPGQQKTALGSSAWMGLSTDNEKVINYYC
ncbi:type VI secretion system baseplate subunit TssG [Kangiella shandongensis]|uniref:type VI secretion system baseplate subunit TssG n=1 Tax=Kangiella shandongensis TaxID=2763258 RepID=UPI001CBCF081|nr:type VI secretion system baseplate subunit TssG [Kangiella shandongensis]